MVRFYTCEGESWQQNFVFSKNGIDGKSMDMKRESSYIRKSSSVVKGMLVVLFMASQVTSECHTDSQCPGDQVCIIETHTQKTEKNFKVEVSVQFLVVLESSFSIQFIQRSPVNVVVRPIISFGSGVASQESRI